MTHTTVQIEAMARAIYRDANAGREYDAALPDSCVVFDADETFRQCVRAAIAALSALAACPPSEGMVTAGKHEEGFHLSDDEGCFSEAQASAVYTAMLTRAVEEAKE